MNKLFYGDFHFAYLSYAGRGCDPDSSPSSTSTSMVLQLPTGGGGGFWNLAILPLKPLPPT